MIRKFLILSLGVSTLALSSCLDIVEELFLNKDGSGTYVLSYDMSAMLSDPTMKAMLEGMMEGDSSGMDYLSDKDTLIRLSQEELMATSNPDFWKNFQMHIDVNQAKGVFKVEMKLPFSDVKDIDYFSKNIASLSETEGGSFAGFGELLPGGTVYELSKGSITRLAPENFEAPSEEDLGMIEMFFGSATYTSIYHLPGKVSKAKMEGSKIDGSTVSVTYPLMDVIQGKAKLEGSI